MFAVIWQCLFPIKIKHDYKTAMKRITAAILLTLVTTCAYADGIVQSTAYIYCGLTHPVEFFNNIRHGNVCEKQHVIQQQQSGGNWENISIIPVSSDITTDTWGGSGVYGQGQVWENKPENDGWGTSDNAEDALAQAYKLGRWQLEYSFLLYDYDGDDWHSTWTQWDGVSHILYTTSWWANFPSKYLRKVAYLIDKNRKLLLIDHAIQLPILLFEGVIGTAYSLFGTVIGTIYNPSDTVNAIIGGVVLIFKSLMMGVIDFFLSIWLVVKSIFWFKNSKIIRVYHVICKIIIKWRVEHALH